MELVVRALEGNVDEFRALWVAAREADDMAADGKRSVAWTPTRDDRINDRWLLIEPMGDDVSNYASLWKGLDVNQSGRPVVVKFLAVGGEVDRRLEIEAVKRLPTGAPHIAPLLDAGTVHARPDLPPNESASYDYLVHPLYELSSLREFLRLRSRSLSFCLKIADQVLIGLSHAHEIGLLHLDIKPSNIVMESPESIHIIDWGLSVSTSAAANAKATATKGIANDITLRGTGTVGFSALEQFLRGGGTDARSEFSDIYGLGATLYWLLTGEPPLFKEYRAAFGTSPSELELWLGFLKRQPQVSRPSDHVPNLPHIIDDLVLRWLQWEPTARTERVVGTTLSPVASARVALEAAMANLSDFTELAVGPALLQASRSPNALDSRGSNGSPTSQRVASQVHNQVLIDYKSDRWVLESRHSELVVGRSARSDIRLPDDSYVSRLAFSLRILEDCVLIRNLSLTKPLTLRPLVGAERVVEPGAATTSLPHYAFKIVLLGRFGAEYVFDVDARQLVPRFNPEPANIITAGAASTITTAIALTETQRRVLVALCEPLIKTRTSAPATYRQIGERIGLRPGYVRNVMKALRELLTGHGVPGLVADYEDAPEPDFRVGLALWAVRSQLVTSADIDRLSSEYDVAPE